MTTELELADSMERFEDKIHNLLTEVESLRSKLNAYDKLDWSLRDLAQAGIGESTAEAVTRMSTERTKEWSAEVFRLDEEIDTLRSALAEVEQRFPCGHRVLDWDDSYGSCSACSLVSVTHDADDLWKALAELVRLDDERKGRVEMRRRADAPSLLREEILRARENAHATEAAMERARKLVEETKS